MASPSLRGFTISIAKALYLFIPLTNLPMTQPQVHQRPIPIDFLEDLQHALYPEEPVLPSSSGPDIGDTEPEPSIDIFKPNDIY